MSAGWVGVDLDATLAHYDGWQGEGVIGEPVPRMLARIKEHLAAGEEVRILTARVWWDRDLPAGMVRNAEVGRVCLETRAIETWCVRHLGRRLRVTCEKDHAMRFCYDDRCRQVVANSGELVEDLVPGGFHGRGR